MRFLFNSSEETLVNVYRHLTPSLLLKKVNTSSRRNYLLAVHALLQQTGEEAWHCQEQLLRAWVSLPKNSLKELKKINHPLFPLIINALRQGIKKSFGTYKFYGLMVLVQLHDEKFNLADKFIDSLIDKIPAHVSALKALRLLTPISTEKQCAHVQAHLQTVINKKYATNHDQEESYKAAIQLLHARAFKVEDKKESEEILSLLFLAYNNSYKAPVVEKFLMKAIKALAPNLSSEKKLSLITPDGNYRRWGTYWRRIYSAIIPFLSVEDRQQALCILEKNYQNFSTTLAIIKELANNFTKEELVKMTSLINQIIIEVKESKDTLWKAYKTKASLPIIWQQEELNEIDSFIIDDLQTTKTRITGALPLFLPLLEKSHSQIFNLLMNSLEHTDWVIRREAWDALAGFLPYLSIQEVNQVFFFSLLAFNEPHQFVRESMLNCLGHYIPKFSALQREAIFVLIFERLKFKNTPWGSRLRDPILRILEALAASLSSAEKQQILTDAKTIFEEKGEAAPKVDDGRQLEITAQKLDEVHGLEIIEQELDEINECYLGEDPLYRRLAASKLIKFAAHLSSDAKNKVLKTIAISLNKEDAKACKDSSEILRKLASTLNLDVDPSSVYSWEKNLQNENTFYWMERQINLRSLQAVVGHFSLEERKEVILITAAALKEEDYRIRNSAMEIIRSLCLHARKKEHQELLALINPFIKKDSCAGDWKEHSTRALAIHNLQFLISSLTVEDFKTIKNNLANPSIDVRQAALQLLTRLPLSSADYLNPDLDNATLNSVEEVLLEVMVTLEKKVDCLMSCETDLNLNYQNQEESLLQCH